LAVVQVLWPSRFVLRRQDVVDADADVAVLGQVRADVLLASAAFNAACPAATVDDDDARVALSLLQLCWQVQIEFLLAALSQVGKILLDLDIGIGCSSKRI